MLLKATPPMIRQSANTPCAFRQYYKFLMEIDKSSIASESTLGASGQNAEQKQVLRTLQSALTENLSKAVCWSAKVSPVQVPCPFPQRTKPQTHSDNTALLTTSATCSRARVRDTCCQQKRKRTYQDTHLHTHVAHFSDHQSEIRKPAQ